ncbi:MAG TPA: hypothetical protein VFU80_03500 [Sphingomicrobium sp.]|nr:hypothetical protein [Sphingomicrobium sp.]
MAIRATRAIIAASALLLASCGPQTLVLPEEPVDRAATCGAVAAASERAATPDINAPLSLESIGRVIHYPLLAGSSGNSFSSETATAVQARMAELQDSVGESKWQDLIPACRAAFPATAIEKVTLPGDRFEAQLGCDELGDFLRDALEMQEEYVNELGEYRQLSNKLDATLGTGLRSRGASNLRTQQEERRKALATMAKAGPPASVMSECLARFG